MSKESQPSRQPDIDVSVRPFEDGLLLGRHKDGSTTIFLRGEVRIRVAPPATPARTPEEEWTFPTTRLNLEDAEDGQLIEDLDHDLFGSNDDEEFFSDAARMPQESAKEQTPQYTARDAAHDFLRPYVRRGDSIDELKSGQMGSYNNKYSAQIGGWMVSWYKLPEEKRTRLKADQVGISRVGKEECHVIYPLEKLYKELEDEQNPDVYKQARLF